MPKDICSQTSCLSVSVIADDLHGHTKSHESKITTQPSENCLSKSATFHSPDYEVATHDDNVRSVDPSSFSSISVLTHLKVVSAMKGSCEKQGVAPPVKLRVKWAPDVYDPVPRKHMSSRHNRKRNSMEKQKKNKLSQEAIKKTWWNIFQDVNWSMLILWN
ncbi:hypothetical protein L1887_09449 [Cichorium endivia]|nr:hypothetical protein L1887_09449 [Cichorium endivia]